MPPCGSPLISTTKSVPVPVSRLSSSSETIRDERGDAIPAMRSRTSCGMTIRSSALLAPPSPPARAATGPHAPALGGGALGPPHGVEQMRADRRIRILDLDRALQDGL